MAEKDNDQKQKKKQNKIAHCCAKKSSNEKPMTEL